MLALALVAFGTALAPPVSDGERWVAIQRSAHKIEIRDDRRGLKRTIDMACRPVSISRGGTLLCAPGEGDLAGGYVAIDLVTHARSAFDVPLNGGTMAGSWAFGAGSTWVAEAQTAYHAGNRQYRNRLTGEVRDADGRGDAVDLDSQNLTAPLCAPLQRISQQQLFNNGTFAFDDWAPFDSYDGTAAALNEVGPEPPHALLWRCGDSKPQGLGGATGLTVGGGWATWSTLDRSAVRVQRISTGRRVKVTGASGAAVHSRRAVYVTTKSKRVYRARLR